MSFKYTGFSFNGVHSDSIPVVAATVSRPIVPEMRRVTITPDAFDGEIDISAANALGRALYEERTFSANLLVTAADIYGLQVVLTKAANWLNGSGDLIFDDLPGIIWDATVEKEIDYAPEREGRKAIISVDFTVKPFGRGQAATGEDVLLGSDVVLGADAVTIGGAHAASGAFSYTEKDGKIYDAIPTFAVENSCEAAVQPIIHWTRTSDIGTEVSVKFETVPKTELIDEDDVYWELDHKYDTKSITVTTDYLDFYINVERGIIWGRKNSLSSYKAMIPDSGAFFELPPGLTRLKVSETGSNRAKADITIDYTPRYLY